MFVYQDGWTSLMWAAKAGKVEVAGLLLDSGADISAKDKVPSSTLCCGLDYPGSMEMISIRYAVVMVILSSIGRTKLLDAGAQILWHYKYG